MPCNRVYTTSVQLGPTTDRALLLAALKTIAQGGQVSEQNGEIAFRTEMFGPVHRIKADNTLVAGSRVKGASADPLASRIKVAYATQAVQKAGRQFGWQITPSKTAPRQFTATRRF